MTRLQLLGAAAIVSALAVTPGFAAPQPAPQASSKIAPQTTAKPAPPAGAQTAAAADPLSGLKYRLVGPFRGGRATGVAGIAGDPRTFYFGSATGGGWKTQDAGVSWKPLWDDFSEAASAIGAVAVAPSDPKVVYVGTGEANIRGNVVGGNGLYRSADAGKTWKAIGLPQSGAVGRIVVDPRDANRLFVAALGHPFGPNPERGVYRSTDGGATWTRALYVDERTGGIDVRFDPTDARVMWAGMWQAYRHPWIMESGGPGSGLYRSADGGESWSRLSGAGLPDGVWGRVNVAPTSDPKRIYAMIEAKAGGLYRSDDAGKTWALINSKNDYRQRAWYFNSVFADPKDPQTVYVLNTSLYRSKDAGKTFKPIRVHHGDTHELWIDPTDTKRMILSDDGGAEITLDGGDTWSSEMNQPTAQFYHVAADDQFPYRLYGAQQDNSTISIATAGRGGGVGIEDWYPVAGGESGYVVPDPTNPEIVYGDGYDAELTRYDHRTDQTREITPWPRNIMGWAPKDIAHRFQWTSPIMVSVHAPHALYFAGEQLYRSDNQGQSWTAVSPDLTRNDKSKQLSSGGPLTKDNTSVETYDTIFSVAESPRRQGLIWVGTDDGLVQLTRDGGAHWANVTPPAMPEWATVDMIEPDPNDPATAYVAADRHRLDDPRPYAFVTHDLGASWRTISDRMPQGAYVHAVRADPVRRGLLYAATERGVLASFDGGEGWRPLQLNLPTVPVHDLTVHGDALALATHGRAFWVLDDLTPVRQWSDAIAGEKAHLFAPAPAGHTLFPSYPGGLRFSGAANPPAGAVITYWLSASVGKPRPKPEEKHDDDKKSPKKPEPADPMDKRLTLQILDADGHVLRSFPEAPPTAFAEAAADLAAGRKQATKTQGEPADAEGEEEEGARAPKPIKLDHFIGLNSFVWDERLAPAIAIPQAPLWAGGVAGPHVLPGRYQVRLTLDGVSQTQPLQITPDPRGPATQADLQRQLQLHTAINAELTDVHRAIIEIRAARVRLGHDHSPAAQADLARMTEIEEALIQPRAHASEDALNYPVRLNNMIAALASLVESGDYPPTDQDEAMFHELKGEADVQLAAWAQLKGRLRR